MSLFKNLSARFHKSLEIRSAHRLHQELKLLDRATLVDAGFSLYLLSKGPSAYPWREQGSDAVVLKAATTKKPVMRDKFAIKRAIAELKSFSDAELNDLGVSRGDIEYVVRHGRPCIEQAATADNRKAVA